MKKLRILFYLLFFSLFAAGIVLLFVNQDRSRFDAPDLAVARVPVLPEENAFTYFLEAGETLSLSADAQSEMMGWIRDRGTGAEAVLPEWWKEIVEGNEEVLRLLEQGSRAEFCLAPDDNEPWFLLSHYEVWMPPLRWLLARAKAQPVSGQYIESAESCMLYLRCLGLLSATPGSYLDGMIAITMLDMGLQETLELLVNGNLQEETLVLLADALSEMPCMQAAMVYLLKVTYQHSARFIDEVRRGNLDRENHFHVPGDPFMKILMATAGSAYHFRPEATKSLIAEYFRSAVTNSSLVYADMTTVDHPYDGLPNDLRALLPLRPNAVGRVLFADSVPELNRPMAQRCRTEASLSAARLAVALHRHEQRHGHWPEELDVLVPEFLPEVPRDPFDGQPFRYRPELGVVYSIGPNLLDDRGAAVARVADEANDPAWQHWRKHDLVFDVWRAPPAADEAQ